MKQIVLLAVILIAVPTFAQQKTRTLTVEQCRTASNQWWDRHIGNTSKKSQQNQYIGWRNA
jgi:hypothetical protein